MFERYTPESRRVIFFARAEAQVAGSNSIESEHLLLALLREDSDLFAAITNLDITEEALRQQIEVVHPAGARLPKDTDLPLTNECKRILALTYEESQRLGDRHIRTEHLLLGMLREDGCFGAKLLRQHGADLTAIRRTFATGEPANPEVSMPDPRRRPSLLDRMRKKLVSPRVSPAPGPFTKAGIKFQKFSKKAQRVLFFGRYEAQQLAAPAIEPEHLLLGITREMASAYSTFLPAHSVAEALRENVRNSPSVPAASPNLLLSERSKQVLIAAQEEAKRCDAQRVRPEHLLFGIVSEKESFAARILRDHGVDATRICQAIDHATSQSDSSRS